LYLGQVPSPRDPIAVVDFSAPHQRYAAGYPQVRWSPIHGCDDFAVAHQRAVALDDLLTWLPHTDDPMPGRILRDEDRADPSALVNLRKRLDRAASKTTSGVALPHAEHEQPRHR
jgi:hypothetical protein